MRNKFAEVIYKEGIKNDKICVVVADISPAGSIAEFRKKYPKRFINCGVAEQAMIGIASGLALKGMRPFCYTIATFSVFRPYEFIRVDVCYQNLPVTIIGMGAGVIYSTLGSTHHTMEDVTLMKALPNMTVIAPCDPAEMKLATQWAANRKSGPVYMRLGKVGEPDLTKDAPEKFKIGKIRQVKKGKDVCIISYGTILKKAFEISSDLKKIKPSIYSCHTIKPLDYARLKKIFNNYKKIFIIEEQVESGGLAEEIKSFAFSNSYNGKIINFNLKDKFIHCYGSYEELLDKHGMSSKKIKSIFNKEIQKK